MEPPPDFMTLKQKRHSVILKKAGVQLTQKIEFKKNGESEEGIAAKNLALKRLEAMSKKKLIVIKTEVSTEKDWKKETQAGCTFWVHKSTGVISTTRPFEVDSDSVCSSLDDTNSLWSESHIDIENNYNHNNHEGENDEEDDLLNYSDSDDASTATGSIVYDPQPFDTLMRELDSMSRCHTSSSSTSSSLSSSLNHPLTAEMKK